MKGSMKTVTAAVSAVLVALTGTSLYAFANVPDSVPAASYEMIEDFNDQTEGPAPTSDTSVVQYQDPWNATVGKDLAFVKRAEGDLAYRFTSDSEADQKGVIGVWFDAFADKKKDLAEGDAIGLYLKVDGGTGEDGTGAVKFKTYLKDKDYAEYINNTAGENAYTLIAKDGTRTDIVHGGWLMEIPANFEGWLVIPAKTFENGGKHPASIMRYYFMLGDANTKGITFTWDDLCVVKNVDTFASGMTTTTTKGETTVATGATTDATGDTTAPTTAPTAAPKPDVVVTENQYKLEDFNSKTVGTSQLTTDFPGDPIGNALPELQYSERTGTDVSGDKALTFKGIKKESGAWYVGFSEDAKAARFAADSDAFAFYLKLEGVDHDDTENHENKFRIFLMDNEGCDFRPLEGGQTYKLISVDGTVTEAKTWAIELFDNFEGWVVIPRTSFEYRWGGNTTHEHTEHDALGANGKPYGISKMAINFATSTTNASFMIDDISIIKDLDAFIESIGGKEEVKDIKVEQTPENSQPIGKDVFESLKANGNKLVIEIGEDYPLYTWTFAGADIATPAAFNPLIATTFDEIAAIKKLDANLNAYFIKVNDMPGKATLSLYLEDVVSKPYLYQYKNGTATLVSDTPFETLAGYVDVTLSEGGVYFLTDAKLGESGEVITTTTAADNGNGDNEPTNGDDGGDSAETGVASYAGLFALLAMGSAVVVLKLRKRA